MTGDLFAIFLSHAQFAVGSKPERPSSTPWPYPGHLSPFHLKSHAAFP